MLIKLFTTKFGSAAMAAAGLVIAGTIASASAAPSTFADSADLSGYTKDQCKDGGWKTFKNPDGSQMFRNQGQCVAFFVTEGNHGGNNNNHGGLTQLWGLLLSFFGWLGNLFSSLGNILRV